VDIITIAIAIISAILVPVVGVNTWLVTRITRNETNVSNSVKDLDELRDRIIDHERECKETRREMLNKLDEVLKSVTEHNDVMQGRVSRLEGTLDQAKCLE